jgi:hypothetical protein
MQFHPLHCLTLLLFALISLQVKHFLADYVWQTKYMLRKTAKKDWQLPLLAHAGFHGALTALVLFPLVGIYAIAYGILDLCIHFLVDLWKARYTEKNPFNKKFWIAFGLDQLAHQLTYIAIAFLAITMAMNLR